MDEDYTEIARPYDTQLSRPQPPSSFESGPTEQQAVRSQNSLTGGMGDIWINTFIRSNNFVTTQAGFDFEGSTGDVELNSGIIGGWNFTNNTFTSNSGDVNFNSYDDTITFGQIGSIFLNGSDFIFSAAGATSGVAQIIGGSTTGKASLLVGTTTYFSADATSASNIASKSIVPVADNTITLGSSTKSWAQLFLNTCGEVVSGGTAGTPFPATWSVASGSTGVTTVTHSLGTTNYAVVAIPKNSGDVICVLNTKGSSSFQINSYTLSGTLVATGFDFILTQNPN